MLIDLQLIEPLTKLAIVKKKTFGFKERKENERKKFIEELKKLNPTDIIYSDEAGMDNNDIKSTAWSAKGSRSFDMKKAHKTQRISFISALNAKKLIASFIFEGPCTRDVYETYLEKVLIPTLRPGQTIILDNASFHKGGKIQKLIESAYCKIMYLPTYSPDLNPIENYWSIIKNKIRNNLKNNDFYESAILAFQNY